MRYARYLIVLSVILISSCTQVTVRNGGESIGVLNIEQALSQSQKLIGEGRWGDAIDLLKEAQRQYPKSAEVKKRLADVERDWKKLQRRLEDRILLFEAVALKQKLPLLKQLSNGKPASYLLRSRVLFWESNASSKSEELLACGAFHADTDIAFAKRCVELAKQLKPSLRADELMQTLQRREKKRAKALKMKKANRKAAKREDKLVQLLSAADVEVERGRYASAIGLLNKALEIEPDNKDVIKRKQKVQLLLDRKVEALIMEGDVLYRRELVEAAVAAWEEALVMDPLREDVAAKINRAHKVLEKLQSYQKKP